MAPHKPNKLKTIVATSVALGAIALGAHYYNPEMNHNNKAVPALTKQLRPISTKTNPRVERLRRKVAEREHMNAYRTLNTLTYRHLLFIGFDEVSVENRIKQADKIQSKILDNIRKLNHIGKNMKSKIDLFSKFLIDKSYLESKMSPTKAEKTLELSLYLFTEYNGHNVKLEQNAIEEFAQNFKLVFSKLDKKDNTKIYKSHLKNII